MAIRTVRACTQCDEDHGDGEGTRFFGVPAWRICVVLCAAMPIALLVYTYTTR
ncbi:hypothetical protein [Streptomyces sp. NPDC005336]|uniref:hypothetical protein n=1 Tax=Streptomyces sp. NPDC005336 TaxID=3157035 RepID=UPI00339E3B74